MHMEIAFSSSGRAAITPHDAIALALLLYAIGEPAALTAAAKLQACAEKTPNGDVPLDNDETTALIRAIASMQRAAFPERLADLQRTLTEPPPGR